MAKLIDFNIASVEFQNNPYPHYARLHSEDAIFHDRRVNAYFVGKCEDVQSILTSPDFTTAPLLERAQPVMGDRVLAQMSGSEHASKRRTVLGGLSGRYFRERYAPMIRGISEMLLRPRMASGSLDLVNQFGKDYGVLVTLSVLGLPTDRYKEIATWHTGIADFITSLEIEEGRKAYDLACSHQLIQYLTPIVEHRLQRPGDDLISLLCIADGQGETMSVSEIVALCLNILLAATEPADKTLALLFKHLMDHPEQLDRVRSNRDLLSAAIDETLRFTSPVQLIPRQAAVDVEISGIKIPADSIVFCMIGAANRDPKAFDAPDTFKIDRKKPEGTTSLGRVARHLAFGAGTHVCVGAAFSLLQIEITANLLLDNLRGLKYSPGFVYKEVGLYTRGPASLCIDFDASASIEVVTSCTAAAAA